MKNVYFHDSPPLTEGLLWLFHHIQLWGDNYFRKDGNPHKVRSIKFYNYSNHTR